MHEAARRNVAVEIARYGDAPHLDDVVVAVLSPCGVLATGGKNDVNENSLVALVKVGDDRALFMGDAGLETERKLLASNVDLRADIADIVKIGHHGSAYATSPDLLVAVTPRIALISVGRHNVFGHPASTTLTRLHERGIRIDRTDRCGALRIPLAAHPIPWPQLPCE